MEYLIELCIIVKEISITLIPASIICIFIEKITATKGAWIIFIVSVILTIASRVAIILLGGVA